jgi:hypothetical protein
VEDIISAHQRRDNDRHGDTASAIRSQTRVDGCAPNVIEHVLLDATLISNVMIFGQAYVKGDAGRTSGAEPAGSAREQDDCISGFYSLFVLVVGSFDAFCLSSFATVQPA